MRNVVFKSSEVKPFVSCTSSFGYGSKWLTGEGPKENSKNNKILKKKHVPKRRAVISLSQEEMTEGNIT